MKKVYSIVTSIILASLVSGCSATKEDYGTIIGGAGGALAGAQFGSGVGKLAMVGAGTLLGAFVGNQVGKSLDKADALYAQQAANAALEKSPTGQAVVWKNPDSGHSGSVTPVRTIENAGTYCREYQQDVSIGGKTQKAFGTACRQPDGTWKIVLQKDARP